MWQSKLLSIAGMVQLKNLYSTTCLYVHFLSLFRIPDSVAKKIISIQTKFFWGCNDCWRLMEAPIEFGGLGLGDIRLKNLGLLSKWWWKYSTMDDTLWMRIIKVLVILLFLVTSTLRVTILVAYRLIQL